MDQPKEIKNKEEKGDVGIEEKRIDKGEKGEIEDEGIKEKRIGKEER
jgi:hypothetical protein